MKTITLLSVLLTMFPAALLAQITETDVKAFKYRLVVLKKKKASVIEVLNKAEKEQKNTAKELEHLRKNLRLSYLVALMDIEYDLAILATPAELITKKANVPGLSSRENDQIPKLRLEIATAERKRVKQGNAEKKHNHGDEKFHTTLLKKEITLWKLYLRAAKKFDREIAKLEKAISKERKARIPDQDDIDALKDQLAELVNEKTTISTPIFGHTVGGGFDQNVQPSLKSAADFLAELKKERDELVHFLRTGETNKGEGEKRGGTIGDTFVYSDSLGVVLDISGSMGSFIQPLKDEIAEFFESPHYREIGDCSLITKHRYPTISLHVSERSYTMSRFSELLIVNKADTLYWFSDLRDEQEPAALRELLNMLIRSGADFNVRSVKEDASRLLEPLITNFEQE